MPGILFVCTGNLYRSPLAAALFLRKLRLEGQPQGWEVQSAGTWAEPDLPAPPELLEAARALNIDLSAHRTRQVNKDLLSRFELIIVMERGHREALGIEFPFLMKRIHLLSETTDQLEYDIADPARSAVPVSEIVIEMQKLIERAYPKICQLAQPGGTPPPPTRRHVNFTL